MTDFKRIICIDFDGVINSYTSGWKGVDKIPDLPVEGAFAWLESMIADDGFKPVIYSSRSVTIAGLKAMKEWFMRYGFESLHQLEFPTQKPAAWLTIDDRAIHFQGSFPSLKEMIDFKPWHSLNPQSFNIEVDDNELADLVEKIQILRNFLNCPEGVTLSGDHRRLLVSQIDAMIAYRGILIARVVLIEQEKTAAAK